MFVITRQPRFDAKMTEQLARMARIFGSNQADAVQNAQRAQGDVFQIANRRRDDVQVACIRPSLPGVDHEDDAF